jgi:hypothetical protein
LVRRRDATAFVAAGGLAVVLFLFYFLAYHARRYPMPVGFDASWYVWRANFVGALGVGPLGTSGRPGHAVLAAMLAGLTGLSQLSLAVILPLALASVFALAVGAFWAAGPGWRSAHMLGSSMWIVAAALAGTLIAASRLVGENVANLLMLALVVAAIAAMAGRVRGARGWWAAVVLLVAAGLAHWIFLGVAVVVLALAALLALPSSARRHREGSSWWSTESGVVASSAAVAGGTMGLLIAGILRAPFRTFEIKEDPGRYLPKFRTDLSRLFVPVLLPLSIVGATALGREYGRADAESDPDRFWIRVLVAWTAVSAVGIVYGALTRDLPPHRFLTLLVALPLSVALAATVALGAGLAGRWGRIAGAAAAGLAVAGLALPGALAWYRHGPGIWTDPRALQQAETASAYLARLPHGPAVFLVDPHGAAGVISVPLKERVIRAGLRPDQETRAHFFAGDPSDLLAGRPSPVGSGRLAETLQPYWEDVRRVLARDPPVLILRAYAGRQFDEATSGLGAAIVGPGVAVLRGPGVRVAPAPGPHPVPRTVAGSFWGLAILAALFAAGAGWARLLLGHEASPAVVACSMPAVGCAALMLGGLVAAKAGVRLGGAGGAVTFVVISAAGFVAAGWDATARRRVDRAA